MNKNQPGRRNNPAALSRPRHNRVAVVAVIVLACALVGVWFAKDFRWWPAQASRTGSDDWAAVDTEKSDGESSIDGRRAQQDDAPKNRFEEVEKPLHPAGPKTKSVEQLVAQRAELDRTVWAQEVEAQDFERPLIHLWDRLRNSTDKYQQLADVVFDSIALGKIADSRKIDLGITIDRYSNPGKTLTHDQWRELVAQIRQEGYRIDYTEWHHSKFEHPADGPPRSTVSVGMHVAHRARGERIILKGTLHIVWSDRRDQRGNPIPRTIDATDIRLIRRVGEPAFEELVIDPNKNHTRATMLAPVILQDLDGDGLSEILLGGCNRLYRNLGGGRFKLDVIAQYRPEDMLMAGVVADFNGDGLPDFMCFLSDNGHLRLFPGIQGGAFGSPVITAREIQPGLTHPFVLTAGDIDGDGDLDLFLGQYKVLHHKGQMPTPYYDANDGYPAFLLCNDGQGHFKDVTEQAGLTKKRFRRTFSASLVDLDNDDDLDLIVVSDFAGVDVYYNDGQGHFADVTGRVLPDRNAFGMSHTFADYDLDGKLDFYVIGMSSTTARRLDSMGLGRVEFPEHQKMRKRMGYGNRMYLARDEAYQLPSFADHVARTGWSWGSTSLDFDNDGDRDIYVGNGLRSGESCKDYCTNYWRHDIYTGDSSDNSQLEKFFSGELKDLMEGNTSWNGYENNALLMNLSGKDFLNIGYLMGVACVYDSRCVIHDDLDGDGRLDLLVVQEGTLGRRGGGQTLHVYRNQWPKNNHWIGVRLREQAAGYSPVGAKVTLYSGPRKQVDQIVTGDSHLSQHAASIHFGLGKMKHVEAIEVRWPNGKVSRIESPAIDRYHQMTAPVRP